MPYMKRGHRGSLLKKGPLTQVPTYYRVLAETALSEIADFGRHTNLKEAVLIARMQASNYLTCTVYGEDNEGNLKEDVFSTRR